MSFFKKLWQADIPEISERHRWLADVSPDFVRRRVCGRAARDVPLDLPRLDAGRGHQLCLRAPSAPGVRTGLGEGLGVGGLLFWLLAAAIVANATIRGVVIHRAYRAHRTSFGRPSPLHQLATYATTNLLNLFFAPTVLLLLAGGANAMGYSWQDGCRRHLVRLRDFAERCIAQVPTIVDLPRPLAFLAMLMTTTFVHYWAHRISDVQRFMWLVIHRLHHTTEDISPATTLPSIMAFPLVFVMLVPYLFAFGAVSKLFYPEPLLYELIAVQLISMVAEIYNHSAALYESTKATWLRWLGFVFFNQAGYRQLHHASDRDERFRKVAYASNLGPGPFSCWDILFGTFRELPDKLPPTGLTDRPRLVKNPLRLLLAGIAQIIQCSSGTSPGARASGSSSARSTTARRSPRTSRSTRTCTSRPVCPPSPRASQRLAHGEKRRDDAIGSLAAFAGSSSG